MKCVDCNKSAEYDSPKNYCLKHWLVWFVDGYKEMSETEKKIEVRRLMKNIRAKERRALDKKSRQS